MSSSIYIPFYDEVAEFTEEQYNYIKDKLMPEVEVIKPTPSERKSFESADTSSVEQRIVEALNPEPPSVQLTVNIHSSSGFIMIAFNKPMQYLKMTKKDAREFARRIVQETLS